LAQPLQAQAQAKEQGLELAAGTIAEAKNLLKKVDKDNLLIKILATLVGLEAITAVLAEGIESLRTNGQLAFARVQY
jgi:transaldolase